MTNINKVLVICLDSASPNFVFPMIKKNELPVLGSIVKKGAYGNLRSTIPPHSSPAWITFMTGLNPGKHGVLGFTNMDLPNYINYGDNVINSTFYKGKTILDYLSSKGKRVISLGLPTTYPPWEINGIMMSGYPTPDERVAFTYPESFGQKFGRLVSKKADIKLASSFETQIKLYQEENEKLTEIAIDLLKNEEWQLFIFFNGILDSVQHTFWQFKSGSSINKDSPYKYVIEDMYKMIDKSLGLILKGINEETLIIVMSDHGSGPRPLKLLNLNYWLNREGLLKKSNAVVTSYGTLLHKSLEYLKSTLPIRDIYRKWIPQRLKKSVSDVRSNQTSIKWSETIAYRVALLYPFEGININLKNRQIKGIVKSNDYEKIRSDIISRVTNISTGETSEKVIEKAYKKEEIYNGPFIDNIPDIILKFNGEYEGGTNLNNLITGTADSSYKKWSGYHTENGIFIANGPIIKKDCELNGASIIDLAPTILFSLGIGIPEIMDGKILKRIFTPDFLEGCNEKYVQLNDKICPTNENVTSLSKEEEEEMKKALKGLGYME